MTVRALFYMGVNVLGGIYIIIIGVYIPTQLYNKLCKNNFCKNV